MLKLTTEMFYCCYADLHVCSGVNCVIPCLQSSFQTLRSWMNELNKHGPPNIVLAIAGNKNDLEDMREVSTRGQQ